MTSPERDWSPLPNPDSSTLTTMALEREITALRDVFNVRLDAEAKATNLHREWAERVEARISVEVTHLEVLVEERFNVQNEKFEGISKQFQERDIRTDQASRSSKEALDAALQAAKELVGAQGEASAAAAIKAEVSTAKQIDQLVVIISTLEKSINDRITELKERIDRGEGNAAAVYDNRVDQRGAGMLWAAVVGTLLVAASIGISVAALLLGR